MAIALQALDVDVQLMILEVLSQTSPRSLLNVALSSRSLYRLSKSFIYRVIYFTFNRSRRDVNRRLIKQLLTDEDLSAKVREIRIIWAPSAKLQPGEGSKEELELLGQALSKFTGLKSFIWDAQYPVLAWLLGTLQTSHPNCLLYTRHPASQNSAQTLWRLRASPCLFSLDVTITTGQFQAFRELQKVLNSVPKLRDLTIASSFDMLFLPHIEQRDPIPLELRSLELYGIRLEFWRLLVVWQKLERLWMDSFSNFPDLAPEFTGLKILRIRLEGQQESAHLAEFLQKCTHLESLDLTGFTTYVQSSSQTFWQNVGKTLIKLRLHDYEKRNMVGDRPVLSMTDLARIAKYSRKLRSLGLDLQCNGQEWPHTMLEYIANDFWFLVHLELNILIETSLHDHPASPKATLGSLPEIWKYLWQQILSSRDRKAHSICTPRLRSLDLIAGPKKSFSRNTNTRDWEADQQRFKFDLSDRDDKARLGIAHVSCTEVDALLSKLSPAGPLWTHQNELIMNTANERARNGPHIKMPSVMDNEMVRPSPFWDRLDEERFYYR